MTALTEQMHTPKPSDTHSSFPLVLGPPDQFAVVREAVAAAGYTEAEIVRRCELVSIYRFTTRRDGRTASTGIDSAFGVLMRLFLDNEPLPSTVVREQLGDSVTQALHSLGLVRTDGDGGQCVPTVLLYPTRSLLIVSDAATPRNGSAMPEDVVFPAITTNTGHFVAMLPDSPTGDLLELCAGTGIAALDAAPRCDHVWATDITERSVHFARFNVLLNDIRNATVAQGDLYEAVGDRLFDRIVAHPPYVPGPETVVIFRDGGEDGEQVTRGIVAGLPAHLRPGGTLHCTCAVTDRVNRPFESRLRDWLGEDAPDFDVFLLQQAAHGATEYYLSRAVQGHEPWDELESRCRLVQQLEIERIVYGSFVVRRRTATDRHPPLTVRRRSTPQLLGSGAMELVEHEMAMADPGVLGRILDVPLQVNPAMEFSLTHQMVDGEWTATDCHLRLQNMFTVDASVSPWIAALLVRCDGERTPRQILAELREDGMAPDEPDMEGELAHLVLALATKDILLTPRDFASRPPESPPGQPGLAMTG